MKPIPSHYTLTAKLLYFWGQPDATIKQHFAAFEVAKESIQREQTKGIPGVDS